MEIIQNWQGELISIKSQETIILRDSQTVFVVDSGTFEVYARPVVGNKLEGAWHYLFTVKSSDALFAVTSSEEYQPYQLVAVAMEKSQLVSLDRNYWSGLIQQENEQAIALLEGWVNHITTILIDEPMPAISLEVNHTDNLELTSGQTLQVNRLLWCLLLEGKAKFLGLESITIDPNSGIFPLSNLAWLKAEDLVQIQLESINHLQNDQILEGLNNLHQMLWQSLQLWEERDLDLAQQRLSKRQQLDQQAIENSVESLASILSPQSKDSQFSPTESPILIAMGAVGRSLGVTIKPPSESEDLSRVDPLEAILRASQLRSRRVLLRDQWWLKDNDGPILGFKEDRTPVALLPAKGNHYQMLDPTNMSRTLVNQEVANSLSLDAYVFYRPLPDKQIKSWDILQFALKGRFWDITIIVVSALCATLFNMLTPILTGVLVNEVIPNDEQGILFQMGAVLLGATFGIASFQLVQGLSLLRLEVTSDATTQAAVWDRVLKLSLPFFRQYSTGDLRSRIEGITEIRRQLSGSTLVTLISSIFTLFNLLLMLYYSWQLTLTVLVITLISVTFTAIIGFIEFKKNHNLLAIEGTIFGTIVQLLSGISALKVNGAEKRAFAYWSNLYRQRSRLNLDVKLLENTSQIFNQFLSPITYIILFWLIVFKINPPQTVGIVSLSLGNFMAFNSSFGSFLASVNNLSSTLLQSLNVINLWQRSQTVLKAPLEIDSSRIDPGRLMGRITVDHVTFRYQPEQPEILKNIFIDVKPGEFIALVGSSGSGKSTLLRLLLGFETPESGAIYYDGKDLSKLNLQAVRRQMGVVIQNGQLQPGSIFKNIAGGALITEEEAWEAAELAGFADDINTMPMKMHTVISEGSSNISGGQKQRLMIARAIVLKPKILLFDEATSALDNKTQAIVSQGLEKMKLTRIVIAHRLSTIRNTDRIYVLAQGQIIQSGSFDELLSQEGLFADLMNRQLA